MILSMTDRASALRILAVLRQTPIGDSAVLVGSSGLFGFATNVEALTEDIDIAIPEAIVTRAGDAIVTALVQMGYQHESGTATFVAQDGTTFDLLGHGEPTSGDHVAASGRLRVMVFHDLSRLINRDRATAPLRDGLTLSPAGFVAAKLLTERGHKGAKDKLQALLIVAERTGDQDFEHELGRLLTAVDPARREDLLASSQEALLALGRDPTFSDAGAEGYGAALVEAERGFSALRRIMEKT